MIYALRMRMFSSNIHIKSSHLMVVTWFDMDAPRKHPNSKNENCRIYDTALHDIFQTGCPMPKVELTVDTMVVKVVKVNRVAVDVSRKPSNSWRVDIM